MWGVGSRSPAAWSAREIELQALATLAALTPSAAHFLKSHQLLVQKFAADRDRQKKAASPFRSRLPRTHAAAVTSAVSAIPNMERRDRFTG